MAIVTLRASTPVGYHAALTQAPDADFERRWTAWQAHGFAHDRLLRQRVLVVAIVAGAIALAALMAYGLLSS